MAAEHDGILGELWTDCWMYVEHGGKLSEIPMTFGNYSAFPTPYEQSRVRWRATRNHTQHGDVSQATFAAPEKREDGVWIEIDCVTLDSTKSPVAKYDEISSDLQIASWVLETKKARDAQSEAQEKLRVMPKDKSDGRAQALLQRELDIERLSQSELLLLVNRLTQEQAACNTTTYTCRQFVRCFFTTFGVPVHVKLGGNGPCIWLCVFKERPLFAVASKGRANYWAPHHVRHEEFKKWCIVHELKLARN